MRQFADDLSMLFFSNLLARFTPALVGPSLANHLLEDADARVGSDPFAAQQLREAAQAALRVVR